MLNKVYPGKRLRIPAADYNAFIDAAIWVKRQEHSTRVQPRSTAGDTVKVLNNEDIAVPRFGLLWLWGFRTDGLYIVRRPSHPYIKGLAIAASPIGPGKIGDAWTSGIHPVLCYDADDLDFPCTAISQSFSYFVRRHSEGALHLLDWYNDVLGDPRVLAVLGS